MNGDFAEDVGRAVRDAFQRMHRQREWADEIVASSRCVNCGKPILKKRQSLLGDGWLHPIKIDVPRSQQRWARFCYQPPSAEPEPGWSEW